MSRKFIYSALFAPLCLLAVSCGSQKDEEKNKEEEKVVEKVQVMELTEKTVNHTIEYPSNMVAFEEIYLAPAAPGRIEKINAEIGSKVNKGQLLVQMDQTQFIQAQIQLQNLSTDYKRLDTLYKVGSASQQSYDQIKTQYDVAKTNIEFLKDNTKLLAPFAGVVSGKFYEDGEMYSGAPNTPAGKAAVLTIVQINKLKAMVAIPESFFPQIKVGMEVKVASDIYPDQTFAAKVYRIYPTIDATSHSFQIEVEVPNGKELLRPGMYCRVTFELGETKALMVPAYAVLKLQGSNNRYVFVSENGKAKRVDVTLGKRFDDQVEIIANGVKKGDKLIVTGQARLVDGVAIDVVQ